MHIFVMINALICVNNYVITCTNSMLSHSKYDNMHKNGIFYVFICINNHIIAWYHGHASNKFETHQF